MNPTTVLMSASALVLGVLGVLGSFLPEELLGMAGGPAAPPLPLLVQLMGALYLGFAALNWMARANLIGGIYSRPVAVGNLMHFLTGGLALVKFLAGAPGMTMLWPLALLYAAFAAGFGAVLFRHPAGASGGRAGPGG